MYRCIGKSCNNHGEITQCTNESETPTWRDIFLCSPCANATPNRHSRPQLQIEHIDVDKPDYEAWGYETWGDEEEGRQEHASQDELDLLDLDRLEELE